MAALFEKKRIIEHFYWHNVCRHLCCYKCCFHDDNPAGAVCSVLPTTDGSRMCVYCNRKCNLEISKEALLWVSDINAELCQLRPSSVPCQDGRVRQYRQSGGYLELEWMTFRVRVEERGRGGIGLEFVDEKCIGLDESWLVAVS